MNYQKFVSGLQTEKPADNATPTTVVAHFSKIMNGPYHSTVFLM